MKLEEVMERQKALNRLNYLLRLRRFQTTLKKDNEWLDLEIAEIEAFLKEKEGEKG